MPHVNEQPPMLPNVLIVDPEPRWQRAFGTALSAADIPYETVNGADDAIRRLRSEMAPKITGVITAALSGEYPRVIEAANNATIVLLRRSTVASNQVAPGLHVFYKKDLEEMGNSEAKRRTRLKSIASLFILE